MDLKLLWNARQAAKHLGVHPSRISQLVTDGRLHPEVTIGNSHMFLKEEIRRFKAIPRVVGRPKKTRKTG